MAVKLHRCSAQWVKIAHPCWRVEEALIDAGIEYERVPGPALPWQRKSRQRLIELTGQDRYPAIQFEDGSVYREESPDMAKTIRAGALFDKAQGSAPTVEPTTAPEVPPAGETPPPAGSPSE
jgi:hypothetical protein